MDPLGKGHLSVDDLSLLKLFRILKPKVRIDWFGSTVTVKFPQSHISNLYLFIEQEPCLRIIHFIVTSSLV